ncbi:MAG: hypothetical protein ABI199_05605 [Bacteroidia bacterium]
MIAFYFAFASLLIFDSNLFYWVSRANLHLLSIIVVAYAIFKAYRLYRKFYDNRNYGNEE